MENQPNDISNEPEKKPEPESSQVNGKRDNDDIGPKEDASPGEIAFQTAKTFLEKDGWFPQQLTNKYVLRMAYSGKNGNQWCYAQVIPDMELFLFYAVAPIKAGEESRQQVAEFITRANYGMRIGNFEMDFSDGEVRYKTSLDFEEEKLTPNLIKHLIYPAAQTLDRYMGGLMNVMYGKQTALAAIEEIEGE